MRWQDRVFHLQKHLEQKFPPAGELVGSEKQVVHAVEAGTQKGIPTILLHGASGNTLDWQTSILPGLAKTHFVIALDRPGFGWSDPPAGGDASLTAQINTLRSCLNSLGHRRYVLVGHSYSGALVMRWALEYPSEVAGIATISGAVIDWGGSLGVGYKIKAAPGTGHVIAQIARFIASPAYLRSALGEIFAPQPIPADYLNTAGVEFALRTATFRLNAAMMDTLGAQVADQMQGYPRICCPVAIIHGTADKIVPYDIHASRLAQILKDAELTRLDGIGHMPHHIEPQKTISAIERLISRAERNRSDLADQQSIPSDH